MVLLLVQAVQEPAQFISQLVIGITNGAIIALVALGYTLVYGIIELINFAHGDNFMIGSFVGLTVLSGTFRRPQFFGAITSNSGTASADRPAFFLPWWSRWSPAGCWAWE